MEHSNLVNGCGALIYCTETKRYLFVLRHNTKYKGTWGIVGGRVEENETTIQGLIREIKEEIGTDFSSKKFIPIETFTSDNEAFAYNTFLVSVEKEFIPVLNNEHRGYAWVKMEDHPNPLHPGVWRAFNFKIIMDKLKTLEEIL